MRTMAACPEDLDLAALADPGATTAVYMPLATLDDLCRRLLRAGADPQRPACAVFNATRPEERRVAGTLATIAEQLRGESPAGPCLVLIGEALRARVHGSGRLQRTAPPQRLPVSARGLSRCAGERGAANRDSHNSTACTPGRPGP